MSDEILTFNLPCRCIWVVREDGVDVRAVVDAPDHKAISGAPNVPRRPVAGVTFASMMRLAFWPFRPRWERR